MRLVTYRDNGNTNVGVVLGDQVVDVGNVAPDMLSVVRGGHRMLDQIHAELQTDRPRHDAARVEFMAPIPRPARNVFCVGLNYLEHALEGAGPRRRPSDVPDLPVWFSKATTSICGPFDDIELDAALSGMYDWEVELAVVIGIGGRRIPAETALDHVHSYTIINDLTARDLQRRPGGQWFKGKSIDRASPLGPQLVTADEIRDVASLRLRCLVNGVVKQNASTEDLLFDIPSLIADISEGTTLLPGDIIATGTPAGVGAGRVPPEFLQPGDELVTEIDQIGRMCNHMVAGSSGGAAS